METSTKEQIRVNILPTKIVVMLVIMMAIETTLASPTCKCMPEDQCWPSHDTWANFNATLGGRLMVPRPAAYPCYATGTDSPACQVALRNWTNPFWRASQPGAMQYSNLEWRGNQTCPIAFGGGIIPAATCSQGAVPSYTVAARTAFDVRQTVSFAARYGLRVTVKSTGHDIMGRSTAPASLNIWLHSLKDIAFDDSFVPAGCGEADAMTPVQAVTVGAGVQWRELYVAANKRQQVVVGAMSGSVSAAGGYLQGGGHSPLSPLYGLAADNVLQFTAITADGRHVTASICSSPDLFWALRGGGGGTYAVVTSATLRTFPEIPRPVGIFINIDTSDAIHFQELLEIFVPLQAALTGSTSSNANFTSTWSGYSYITTDPYNLQVNYLVVNSSVNEARAGVQPLIDFVNRHASQVSNVNVTVGRFRTFLNWQMTVLCTANPGICSDTCGSNAAVASRLIPKSIIQDRSSDIARAFMQILTSGRVQKIVGHLVGGGAVANSSAQDSNAVNPAWRKALWHVVLISWWGSEELGLKQGIAERIEGIHGGLTQMNGLLRQLTPESGSYLNEADVFEPNWQASFFGEHYERLKAIKQRYDPQGLFTCSTCVGSEDWSHDLKCRN